MKIHIRRHRGVKEALAYFHTDDLRLYPDPVVTDLVDGIAQFYQVDPSQVFVGVGSDDVLAMLFMTSLIQRSRFCFRILPIPFMTCGQKCFAFRIHRFRWMMHSA